MPALSNSPQRRLIAPVFLFAAFALSLVLAQLPIAALPSSTLLYSTYLGRSGTDVGKA